MGYRLETKCIHGEQNPVGEHPYGAVAVPIFQTATYAHPGIGKSSGFDYTRESNPTRKELEARVSALEGAVDSLACSTGMAAIGLCLELLQEGCHVLCTEDLYGGSVRMFETTAKRRGLSFSYVDTTEPALVRQALRPETGALYIETPSNPTMQVTDLAAMAEIAREHGLLLIVDNTFLSPYFQNPLALGAHLVVHSGTKFLGGHNDTLAGFVCTSDAKLAAQLRYLYKTCGVCLAPFDSYLLLRGIKTLAVRMERQQENALEIASWLQSHPAVEKVYYTGLSEHPAYELSRRQARGFGSMISVALKESETAQRVLEKVKVFSYAESLGGVESLITYPMLQTHGDVPEAQRLKLGITDSFLRISVGIEQKEDLIEDLAQALEG